MDKKETKIRKGEKLVITAGEYSSYTIIGAFVAQEDFDLTEAKKEYYQYLETNNLLDEIFSLYGFVNWAVNLKNLIVEFSMREVFLTQSSYTFGFMDNTEEVSQLNINDTFPYPKKED